MAKPVAVDVPGALEVLALGRRATERGRCFLVDYQLPTDPITLKFRSESVPGRSASLPWLPAAILAAVGRSPRTSTAESRFQRLIWCNDTVLGGSHHVNACLHAVDAVLWVLGKKPILASGFSAIARDNPHSDSHDVLAISYTFADGVVWDHCGRHLNNLYPFECGALIHGTTGYAQVSYEGAVRLKGAEEAYSGEVAELYQAGARRNVAAFYLQITEGHFENATVSRAVDGVLTTVLSREAALRRAPLSLENIIARTGGWNWTLRG